MSSGPTSATASTENAIAVPSQNGHVAHDRARDVRLRVGRDARPRAGAARSRRSRRPRRRRRPRPRRRARAAKPRESRVSLFSSTTTSSPSARARSKAQFAVPIQRRFAPVRTTSTPAAQPGSDVVALVVDDDEPEPVGQQRVVTEQVAQDRVGQLGRPVRRDARRVGAPEQGTWPMPLQGRGSDRAVAVMLGPRRLRCIVVGFTKAELEAFRDASVPDLVGPDPRLVFVGINPGLWTAAVQTPLRPAGQPLLPRPAAGRDHRPADRPGDRAHRRRPRLPPRPRPRQHQPRQPRHRARRRADARRAAGRAGPGWRRSSREHRPARRRGRRRHGVPDGVRRAEGPGRRAAARHRARRARRPGCGSCPTRAGSTRTTPSRAWPPRTPNPPGPQVLLPGAPR